jgi:Kef-type K+ transport system membrane component KefB
MTPGLIFLVQALVVIVLPIAILRFSRLKGRVPLVVVQIVVGLALGPSLFGRLAPEHYQLFFNEAALAPLSGIASVAVLVFGLITGLHLDPKTFRRNGGATSAVAFANIDLAVPAASGSSLAIQKNWRRGSLRWSSP